MGAIEERAIQNLIYEQDFCGHRLSDSMVCRAYVKGATDQKALDIDKACEWLKEQVYQEYSGGPLERLIPDTMIEEFRKAMEEEL